MRTLFFIALSVFITVGCDRTEVPPDCKIVEGSYWGRFQYQGVKYGYSLTLDSSNYRENMSGGLYYQKRPGCFSVGTYLVQNDKLVFELDSFLLNASTDIWRCNPDWLLPGEYTIDYCSDDSLVFERGEGDSLIIYYIKKDITF